MTSQEGLRMHPTLMNSCSNDDRDALINSGANGSWSAHIILALRRKNDTSTHICSSCNCRLNHSVASSSRTLYHGPYLDGLVKSIG